MTGRTALVTGGSRGIGAAIALRLAAAGANVAILDVASDERPARLPGTVESVAAEVDAAGGRGLAVAADLRQDADVEAALARTVETFGGLDIVVNNAAAFDTTPTSAVTMKRYDLLHGVNARGSFLVSRTAIPHLEKSPAAHVLSISPPLTLDPRWLGAHLAYTSSKYAVSLMTLGLAAELAERGIAANSVWPSTAIATEAIRTILGEEVASRRARRPAIIADAAYAVLRRDPRTYTGHLLTDVEALRAAGVTDLSGYAVEGGPADDTELERSFFLPEDHA